MTDNIHNIDRLNDALRLFQESLENIDIDENKELSNNINTDETITTKLPVNKFKKDHKKKNKKKNRCNHTDCNKILSLIDMQITCKCENNYCSKHMNPYNHQCIYDSKIEHRTRIRVNNPKCENFLFEKL